MPTLLLVEDDPFLCEIYARTFRRDGFEVRTASDGEEGARAAVGADVILLDLVMPRCDGFEALERLKQNAATAPIPVIILSNLGQHQDIDRSMRLGAAGYIMKTHALPDDVVRIVQKTLGQKT